MQHAKKFSPMRKVYPYPPSCRKICTSYYGVGDEAQDSPCQELIPLRCALIYVDDAQDCAGIGRGRLYKSPNSLQQVCDKSLLPPGRRAVPLARGEHNCRHVPAYVDLLPVMASIHPDFGRLAHDG